MKKFRIVNIGLISCLSLFFWVIASDGRLSAQQVDGKYSLNYPNGRLKERGYYKNGLKHRTWYFYSETGVMERREKWNNGVLQEQVFYNAKGKVIKTIDRNGKEFNRPPCNCT